jgi:hypothetical protein
VGVIFGLLIPAFLARTADLDRLDPLLQRLRREPGPETARLLSIAAHGSVSANDRLQYLLRPRSSFVIVPLFASTSATLLSANRFGAANADDATSFDASDERRQLSPRWAADPACIPPVTGGTSGGEACPLSVAAPR